jgi:hypothetical protein
MRRFEGARFHPFYHEIVAVEGAPDAAEPISLVGTVWPGFMLGQLMFCRAGVRVHGGTDHVRKAVAEESALFWTYRRNNRPTSDRSHGWGHNSQWSTEFRRDYDGETTFYYNVDGDYDVLQRGEAPGPAISEHAAVSLPRAQAIELVTNRCLIVSELSTAGTEPFGDCYREDKP